MKVSQLQPGMLLAPVQGRQLVLLKSFGLNRKGEEDNEITVCRSIDANNSVSHFGNVIGAVIYLGSNFDRFVWDGVYKHHRVLAGDIIALVSGYHIKDFCPAGVT